MNGYQLTAELVRALSWPVAIFAVALLFRKDLSSLIARISSLKWRDLEVHLQDWLDDAKGKDERNELPPEAEAVAVKNPRQAVLQQWDSLETVLRELASKHTTSVPRTFRGLGLFLSRRSLISAELHSRIDSLRNFQGAVKKHGAVVDEDMAVEFTQAAIDVRAEVSKLLETQA